jgi:hypothetical protein
LLPNSQGRFCGPVSGHSNKTSGNSTFCGATSRNSAA